MRGLSLNVTRKAHCQSARGSGHGWQLAVQLNAYFVILNQRLENPAVTDSAASLAESSDLGLVQRKSGDGYRTHS